MSKQNVVAKDLLMAGQLVTSMAGVLLTSAVVAALASLESPGKHTAPVAVRVQTLDGQARTKS